MREVLPAPEGWCVVGGEMSSRIGDVEVGKKRSSSGIWKCLNGAND